MGVHPQPSARADLFIMMECTPDIGIGNGHSVCTVFCGCDPTRAGSRVTEIMFKPFVCLIVEHWTDISSVKLQMFKTMMKEDEANLTWVKLDMPRTMLNMLSSAQEAKKMRLTLPG